MGFLTKEERETWRVAVGDGHVFQPEDVELVLDTIDALDARVKELEDVVRTINNKSAPKSTGDFLGDIHAARSALLIINDLSREVVSKEGDK